MNLTNTIILIYGLPCSGKSTLGQSIATRLNTTLISTEVLWGLIFNRSKSKDDLDMTPEELRIVYKSTNRISDLLIESGHSVVIDGVFRKNDSRLDIENIAKKHNARIIKIFLKSNDAVAKKRLLERKIAGSIAPAGPMTYERIKNEYEFPYDNDMVIDTSDLTDLETLSNVLELIGIRQ